VFFGEPNQDPKLNPKVPFSDKARTVAASATQTLDANGMYTLELFLKGSYSIQIDDTNDVLFESLASIEGSDAQETPLDFGAAGTGATNDDSAFTSLEAVITGQVVDLLDKTYLVTTEPSANTYINGQWKIVANTYTANGLERRNKRLYSGNFNTIQEAYTAAAGKTLVITEEPTILSQLTIPANVIIENPFKFRILVGFTSAGNAASIIGGTSLRGHGLSAHLLTTFTTDRLITIADDSDLDFVICTSVDQISNRTDTLDAAAYLAGDDITVRSIFTETYFCVRCRSRS